MPSNNTPHAPAPDFFGDPAEPLGAAPPPLTDPGRFTLTVRSLPEPLSGLLAALEPYVAPPGGREPSRAVYVAVRLAVDAWEGGDEWAAHAALMQAHTVAEAAAADAVAPAPDRRAGPGVDPGPGGWPRFPAAPQPPEGLSGQFHARSARPAEALDGPVYAATDASWRGSAFGYGYALTTGLWGVRYGAMVDPRPFVERDGHSLRLTPWEVSCVHELRAVAHMMYWLPRHLKPGTPVVLLIDNSEARAHLKKWREGNESFVSGVDRLRPRQGKAAPLSALARTMRENPAVSVEAVKGHSGHPLNELADSLAKMARRHAEGETVDLLERGGDLVNSFLTSWEAGGEGRTGSAGRQRFTPGAG